MFLGVEETANRMVRNMDKIDRSIKGSHTSQYKTHVGILYRSFLRNKALVEKLFS